METMIAPGIDIRAGKSINIIGTDHCTLEAYASSLGDGWEVFEDDKCIYLKANTWKESFRGIAIPSGMPLSSLESYIDENDRLVVTVRARSRGAFGSSCTTRTYKSTFDLPPGIDRLHEPKRTMWAKDGIIQLAFYKK